ncbi:MAG: TetR/AcrR family transcriptional regulator [Proteobacteria bacterium]|nr:MAG: TetR/AcrR family transcriptional regulator [Pseudomonadota bacterium]
MPRSEPNKNERFERVSAATIDLIVKRGLDAVSVSKISTRSQVSRAWIYKYYGKTSAEVIRTAAQHFGRELEQLRGPSAHFNSAQEWVEYLIEGSYELLIYFQTHPAVFQVYLQFWNAPHVLGQEVRAFEEERLSQVASSIHRLYGTPKPQALLTAKLIFGIRLGIFHRFLNEDMPKDVFLKLLHEVFSETLQKLPKLKSRKLI